MSPFCMAASAMERTTRALPSTTPPEIEIHLGEHLLQHEIFHMLCQEAIGGPGDDLDHLLHVAPNWSPRQLSGALLHGVPEGLDTVVGQGGHPLTAAQAQQLALARLALAEPELVLLDEATAGADTADTSLLDAAASAVTQGKTALVIAHRLSQAAAADRHHRARRRPHRGIGHA